MEQSNFFIVGIGASAGGLEVLRAFFDVIPRDTGAAFVVVQHLSPNHKSLMAELLRPHCRMPVLTIEKDTLVQPNHVYLAPPAKVMKMKQNVLVLEDKKEFDYEHQVIDTFFKSLAQEQQKQAIALVLSGMGTDGSRGIRAIHEQGGLVMVQEPKSAKFEGMPMSSASTGLADLSAPLDELASELTSYLKGFSMIVQRNGEGADMDLSSFNEVVSLISKESEINFDAYKKATLLRQVKKYLDQEGLGSLKELVETLKEKPELIPLISKEFLIKVTSFFRDKEAFLALESKVFPKLFDPQNGHKTIRVWVVGCSSGEEVYSLAFLMEQYLKQHELTISYKIFAVDIDEGNLEYASSATYAEKYLADVPEEVLNEYFDKQMNGYQVRSFIRQKIVFTRQDILRNPPFNNIDLVVCRNLLIYFELDAQAVALQKMHFALNENGYLMMGASESLGELEHYYQPLDRKWRIYQKKPGLKYPSIANFMNVASVEYKLKDSDRALRDIQTRKPAYTYEEKHYVNLLLDLFCPASVITDELFNVLYMAGPIEQFLQLPKLQVRYNLQNMVDQGLGSAIRTLSRKIEKNDQTHEMNYLLGEGLGYLKVRMTRKQSGSADKVLYVTEFHTSAEYVGGVDMGKVKTIESASLSQDEVLSNLQQELQVTQQELQATVEELESTNEELQASNEELMASNEELQGTNEELQSVNEELLILNAELQNKMEELSELNEDMSNLLESSRIGTIFLDNEMRVRRFTEEACQVISLRESDLGRPITDLSLRIKHESFDLLKRIEEVKASKMPFRIELRSTNLRWYLLQITPFLTERREVSGVLLMFIDLIESEKRFRSIAQNLPDMIMRYNKNLQCVFVNQAMLEQGAFQEEDYLNKTTLQTGYPEPIARRWMENLQKVFETQEVVTHFEDYQLPGGARYLQSKMVPEFNESGEVETVLTITHDVTALKSAQIQLERLNKKLEEKNNTLMQFAYIASHDLNEPIRTIQNYVAALVEESRGQLNEDMESYVKHIDASAKHLNRLVEGLLEYSRLGQSGHLTTLNSQEVVEELMNELLPKFPEVTVDYQLEALPSLEVFEIEFRLLLRNLIHNAIKFREETRPPRVDILAREEAETWLFAVKDNGIGIDPKFQEKIFDIFKQLQITDHPGTGIGLAHCRRVAALHQGTIWVESTPGEGSTFFFTISKHITLNHPPMRRETLANSDNSANNLSVREVNLSNDRPPS